MAKKYMCTVVCNWYKNDRNVVNACHPDAQVYTCRYKLATIATSVVLRNFVETSTNLPTSILFKTYYWY